MKSIFKKSIQSIVPIVLCFQLAISQQTPGLAQTEAITIQGATAHIGNGTVIENATLVFENGKITAIGDKNTATKGTVIKAEGKHVYPGLIAPCTTLGLVEVDAVRASDDQKEIGDFIPNVRSIIAYNAESKVVESMRPNGVLLGQITPNGGAISGSSSVVQFDAWNWEDAAVKTDDGIHLHWPNSFKRGRWWMGEDPSYQPNKKYTESVSKISTFIKNAFAYNQTTSPTKNLAFAAMKGVFSGDKKLFVYADGENEIIDAITSLKANNVKNIVLVGGYHAYKITSFLKDNNIEVLVRATHNLPEFDDDDYDLPYKLPKLLTEAGLTVALQNKDAMVFQTRNLPFYAGTLVAQGMNKEDALKLITLNAAKIVGIDKDYGSLTVGKSATLFISEGDALNMIGNNLTHAFIDGRALSLETHQTELWKKYEAKYEQAKK